MNPSQKIDEYVAALPGWQRENLAGFRALVHEIEPGITEDWKWNVPFFIYDGKMMFAMSAFKTHTKYNFLTGPSLADPAKLFNGGLESKGARGIDLKENESVSRDALAGLVREAIQGAHGA